MKRVLKREELSDESGFFVPASNGRVWASNELDLYKFSPPDGSYILLEEGTKEYIYWKKIAEDKIRDEKNREHEKKENTKKTEEPKPDAERKKEKEEPKETTAIKQSTVSEDQETYILMDRRDEEQIIEEIQGRFLSDFVYSFTSSTGGRVTGLSWAGVKEIARRIGNISIEEIKLDETEASYRVLAKAKDLTRNITFYGVAEQSKTVTLRSGETIPDPFALQKAVSKAQRNAIRGLIPEVMIKAMIEEYQQRRNGRD